MAHKVTFSLPKRELGHSDIEFVVHRDGTVFGKLLVSKGAVVWRRKSKSWRGKKLGWADFHKLMQKHARAEH
jgi:hypothetical protein